MPLSDVHERRFLAAIAIIGLAMYCIGVWSGLIIGDNVCAERLERIEMRVDEILEAAREMADAAE